MRKLILFLGALALVSIVSAADLTGKWTGSLAGGDEHENGAVFMLKQAGSDLTGTAGPNEDKQYPISNGKVDGDKVMFDVITNGPVMHFTLTVSEKHLSGNVHGEHEGQTRDGKIEMTKAD